MTRSPSPPARALLWSIRTYQGLRAGRLSPCRFVPSCSEYAAEAVEVHGAFKGSWLAARRVSRCRPLGGRGFDPVPN
ncbi:MAG: membrane protein insertion efficiency factor YidD [Actinomycetota bacterium]|nr:membrane protein insertion efficiency factor YidD [Actinomycetota bacterium]